MVKTITIRLDEDIFRQLKNLKEEYMIVNGLTKFSWESWFVMKSMEKKGKSKPYTKVMWTDTRT